MTDEPALVSSPKSQSIIVDGYRFDIEIHRLDFETGWTLEVVDQDGTSHVWDEQFASDKDARNAAVNALQEAGAITFMTNDSIVPFRRH
ncbi:hypothetical protein [Ruegeria hyattellae]|uniref:hypothetical protein n=1 Tax=Ruegeria hyattellae TaxID=3233337 RepID=UPI00355AFD4B